MNIEAIKYWAKAIATDSVLAGALGEKSWFEKSPKRHAGFDYYHGATELAMISALVWIGYVVLPIALFVGDMAYRAARVRAPKTKVIA